MSHATVLVLILGLLASANAAAKSYDSITTIAAGPGRGFDIVHERIKAPLVKFSYEYGNEFPWNNDRFTVPDQVDVVPTPRSTADSKFVLFKSYQEFFSTYLSTSSLAASTHIGPVELTGAFSRTKGEISELLRNNTRAASTVNNVYGLFQLSLFPSLMAEEYDPRFMRAVKNLPSSFNATSYGAFVAAWGTHYIQSAQFACKANFTVAFNSEFLVKKNNSFVSQQLSATIGYALHNMSFQSNLATNESHIDEEFQREMGSVRTITGGDGHVLEQSGVGAWIETCRAAPGLVLDLSELSPISVLVEDSNKASNIDKAIINYCNNSSFRERAKRAAEEYAQI